MDIDSTFFKSLFNFLCIRGFDTKVVYYSRTFPGVKLSSLSPLPPISILHPWSQLTVTATVGKNENEKCAYQNNCNRFANSSENFFCNEVWSCYFFRFISIRMFLFWRSNACFKFPVSGFSQLYGYVACVNAILILICSCTMWKSCERKK